MVPFCDDSDIMLLKRRLNLKLNGLLLFPQTSLLSVHTVESRVEDGHRSPTKGVLLLTSTNRSKEA